MSATPEASSPPLSWLVRPVQSGDAESLCRLIGELAEFEHLSHQLEVTPEALRAHLLGPASSAGGLVAEAEGGGLVGYAIFFRSFSTFLGRPGLWLEDLYVTPSHRGQGVGGALLRAFVTLARESGCGRCEWTVLDWNANAIEIYRASGADVLPDWRIVRMDRGAMARYLGGNA